jgi:predicted MFS family arabinose efflux permease
VALACTVAVFGVTETTIAGITMVAKADAEVLVTEVAVMVTVKSAEGGVLGAV